MAALDGRYTWHDDAEPGETEFLASVSSLAHRPDGETAVAYVGLYDARGEPIGDIGLDPADLPDGLGTVYRVEVEDGRIVDLAFGPEVSQAWREARDQRR